MGSVPLFTSNWLRVLDTTERSPVDQRVPQQLHPVVALLDVKIPAEESPMVCARSQSSCHLSYIPHAPQTGHEASRHAMAWSEGLRDAQQGRRTVRVLAWWHSLSCRAPEGLEASSTAKGGKNGQAMAITVEARVCSVPRTGCGDYRRVRKVSCPLPPSTMSNQWYTPSLSSCALTAPPSW